MNPHSYPSKPKVIAIALEAANMYLIENWCAEGKLPTLQSLMKKGTWRKLASTADVGSGSTWPSLHTGCNPAKHSIARAHRHLKSGTYEIEKQYSNQVKQAPFWEYLSQANKRCAILDVEMSVPKKDFNGIHLVSWGDEAQTWKPASWPLSFGKEVVKKFGYHPLRGWYQQRPRNKEEYSELTSKLLKGVQTRTQLAKYVLSKENWDLFLLVYSELHWAGHALWHTMDSNHPAYTPELAKDFGDVMLRCYQEVDKGIEQLIANHEDATIMIFSNSSMTANYSGRHLVPEVLKKMGLSGETTAKKKKSIWSWLPANKWGSLTFEKVERVVSIEVIEAVKKLIPEKLWDTWTRKLLYSGSNWKESLAFSTPSDYSGTIRINLAGREPSGKVQQGKEYDEICDRIIRVFEELQHPHTGEKMVSSVFKVSDVYQGKYLDELPDIVVNWASDAPIEALYSPQIGTVAGTLTDKRSGGHLPYGFLLMSGKGVVSNRQMKKAHIMDIAATITHILGVEIPSIMDGKILPEFSEIKGNV